MTNRSREAVEPLTGSKMEPKYELTDEQWNLISDLFAETPIGPKGGRPVAASRGCVEGILWILRSGARWKDLPKHFPSATTCWRPHRQWTKSGIWQVAWKRWVLLLDRKGEVDHEESFADGTFASAKKGVKRLARPSEAREPRSWFLPTETVSRLASTPPVPVPTKSH
jgi:transposase